MLFCKMCETKVTADGRFTLQQHVGRDKRIRALQLISQKKSTQLLLQESVSMMDNKSSENFVSSSFCEPDPEQC